ncbi:DUF1829 domain-containing protein [Bhargavaea cecembensis]|uniref:DUF1829 domain-containing protein n=1 Tax=Bhargavaea cecembensis TaxID=394098 RepID=UPI00058E4CB9|nr:DUF1829 domain-containing protein [Bhargavaea cecembensis]
MVSTIQDSYFQWIRENSVFSPVLNEAIELSTPFIDSLNENVKIYLIPESGLWKVTDDGFTMWSLDAMGMGFRKGSHREGMMRRTIDRYQVQLDPLTRELFIKTAPDTIGQSIHYLIQAVLSVSDFLQINQKNIKNLFNEEVQQYFDSQRNLYDAFADFELQGKSKLMHRFDYLMTVKDRKKKLVRLINHLDQTQLERTLLSWQDTSQQRAAKYHDQLSMAVVVNDRQRPIDPKSERAFMEYEIEPIPFSNKKLMQQSLSIGG